MPATAGRVRMPANNRVHSSAALQTHGIWQSAIGYDPYAPNKEDKKDSSQNLPNTEPDAENAYASFQGLLQLAKITNADVDISRGACKKCGRVGHLKFQCKNYVKIKDESEEKDPEAMQPVGLAGLDKKLKAEKVDRRSNVESSEEDEEEDSESSDSEVDSEIERIIAERSGKKISGRGGSSRKKEDSDDDDSNKDSSKKRRKRGRSKKRSAKRDVSDSDDSSERSRRRKRRRDHRRKRDKSPEEDDEYRSRRRKSRKEKRRRRSRLSDSNSESSDSSVRRHKRKGKRASSSSDTDSSGYNDSRMGRDANKSEKRRRRHRDEE
ncbi:hypothetical protein RJT34_25679 [Clitoria ternatea]|uniref:CCHC-type domain-containing protein n=1 Tax=Clitoria ternatea TaxID=43366 RepID=A0AAN9IJ11_CLITE